ncbi:MAG: hypothetical protein KDJ38_00225 [Gammaproteobacteria bacterium]|nr:hypothetical protein [Gammaproteobacteria bacterium]
MSNTNCTYRVKVVYAENLPVSLFSAGEIFIGPHTRPASYAGADLISRELAEEYLSALMPIFQRRYGECELKVVEISGTINKKLEKKIVSDTSMVRARIDTNNFAPNKSPY